MKNILIILIPISIIALSFTYNSNSKNYTPPGTVEITSGFYMDKTEVTIISWMEYMYWVEKNYGKDSEQHLASYPDTNVWNNPFREHYFSHPAYSEYPIVGITWQQANAFCKWRSDRVMEQLLLKKEMNPKLTIPSSVTYRLPTFKEWEDIAGAGYSEKTQKKLDKKHSECNQGNFKTELKPDSIQNTTAPVLSYWPNKYGVYNIMGNVAEMTSKEGIAKGGSWIDSEKETTLKNEFEYNKPENWVGLRCVCEVKY